jgi:hypothetical protein
MLQRLGDHISACLQRGDQCKEAAAQESDERVRSQLLDLERQWRHVAKSYEFIESLERFLVDQQKVTLAKAAEAPPPNAISETTSPGTAENPPPKNFDA